MDEIVKLNRMTVDELRRMPYDTPTAYQLRNVRACYSARSLAHMQQFLIECKFSTALDKDNAILTITKKHLPKKGDTLTN